MTEYLTLKALAARVSMSESTLRSHLGEIPYHRIRPGGKILVKVSDFEDWMQTKRVAAQEALEDPEVREFLEGLLAVK